MKHSLEADSIILEFGAKRVLQDVYLKSETGQVTGLLGRNGTGKTCLMNIIYGELNPTDKSIRLDGIAAINGLRHPELVRYLPQHRFIPGPLTIKRIFKDFRLDFEEFVHEFPEFEKYHKTRLNKLSGGERRIVEVYAILGSKTKFCLLDEPFSHIMPAHVDVIRKLILREKQTKGIIITDHMYQHIIDICDQLYVIHAGKTYLTKSLQDLETFGYLKIYSESNNLGG